MASLTKMRTTSPLWLAACLLFFQLSCWAEIPSPLLADFTHTAWGRLQDGPVDVLKITQTTDGWLWVATATGLFRFDGVRFERVDNVYGHPLDSSNVIGLTADKTGGLWVGYRLGGVTLFRPDRMREYGDAEGLPTGGVIHIEAVDDGSVWVGTRDGAAWLAPHATRFQRLGKEVGLPEKFVYQILIARDGTQWIGSLQGLFFRKPGQRRFSQAWPRTQLLAFAEAPDGTLWARDKTYHYYKVRTEAPPRGRPLKPAFPGMGMRFSTDQTMWVLHTDGIERRLVHEGENYPDQKLTQNLGMSGPQAQCFFEDREGDIWVGTASGIDRIRRNRLRSVILGKALEEPGLAPGPGGAIVVGDRANRSMYLLKSNGATPIQLRGSITAHYRSADGTVYLGSDTGIFMMRPNGSVSTIVPPDDVRGFYPQSMLRDSGGVLWVSFSSGPLYRWTGGRWESVDMKTNAGQALVLAMAADSRGDIWLAHANNSISIVDHQVGLKGRLDATTGLDLGAILDLTPDGDRMWLAGERGVMLYRRGRLVALRGLGKETFRGVSGLVRTPAGDMWMHGAEGIYHIPSIEIGRWLNDPTSPPAFERFDARDGLIGHAMQLRPIPSLVQGDDGRLWFSTSSAVYSLDPQHIPRNRYAPPVFVRSVSESGDKSALVKSGNLVLPQGSASAHIEYTALALRLPERARFRYKLTGVDATWQGPTERRDAFYTNLRPGNYRFEVVAANEDNVWYPVPATLDIRIPPTFTQTIWFKISIAIAVLALLCVMHVLRVRVLAQRMQERLAERARIARSLHDTLLQSVQGLILSFGAHLEFMPKESRGHERLAHTLKMAEQLLAEGRDEIMDLRSQPGDSALFDALSEFGRTLTEIGDHDFESRLVGTPWPLQARAYDEIYAIGREALFNAVHHSRAGVISLLVEYGRSEFRLVVRDNGRGFTHDVNSIPEKARHWGIQGVLERSRLIEADLQVISEAGLGVSVVLCVSRKIAYDRGAALRRKVKSA